MKYPITLCRALLTHTIIGRQVKVILESLEYV